MRPTAEQPGPASLVKSGATIQDYYQTAKKVESVADKTQELARRGSKKVVKGFRKAARKVDKAADKKIPLKRGVLKAGLAGAIPVLPLASVGAKRGTKGAAVGASLVGAKAGMVAGAPLGLPGAAIGSVVGSGLGAALTQTKRGRKLIKQVGQSRATRAATKAAKKVGATARKVGSEVKGQAKAVGYGLAGRRLAADVANLVGARGPSRISGIKAGLAARKAKKAFEQSKKDIQILTKKATTMSTTELFFTKVAQQVVVQAPEQKKPSLAKRVGRLALTGAAVGGALYGLNKLRAKPAKSLPGGSVKRLMPASPYRGPMPKGQTVLPRES